VADRNGVAEEQRARGVVVVAIPALNDLGPQRGDELPDVKTPAAANGRDVADVGLFEIEVLGLAGLRVAEQTRRGRDPRDRRAGDQIDAEARLARLGGRPLETQLGDVDLEMRSPLVPDGGRLKLYR
jgi:hypothetical protein